MICRMQFMVLYVFGEDCLGTWLQLWTPCRNSDHSFELSGTIPATGDHNADGTYCISGYCSSEALIPLIHHDDVCGQQEPVPGRCARFVLEGLGKLMMAKLTFTAFVTPAMSLLLSLPLVRRAEEAALTCLLRRPYTASVSGDTELAGLVMLMDLAFIFGFAIPLVLPLLCIAFAAQLAVHHLSTERLGMEVQYQAKPACRYLAVSVLLGSGLNLWFFIDNRNQVAGEALVTAGIPVGLCVGLAIGAVWYYCQASDQIVEDVASVPCSTDFSPGASPYVLMEDNDTPCMELGDGSSATRIRDGHDAPDLSGAELYKQYAQDAMAHGRAVHVGHRDSSPSMKLMESYSTRSYVDVWKN